MATSVYWDQYTEVAVTYIMSVTLAGFTYLHKNSWLHTQGTQTHCIILQCTCLAILPTYISHCPGNHGIWHMESPRTWYGIWVYGFWWSARANKIHRTTGRYKLYSYHHITYQKAVYQLSFTPSLFSLGFRRCCRSVWSDMAWTLPLASSSRMRLPGWLSVCTRYTLAYRYVSFWQRH